MKKIIIEDGLSLYNKTGIGQYTQNLYEIMQNLGYDILMPRKYFLERISNSYLRRFLYILWVNLVFPFYIYFNQVNTVIFSNTNSPLYKLPKVKYYIVLHDLWANQFPETMGVIKKNYANFVISNIKRLAYKIITVSETVKKEIVDFYKCDESFVKVIYNYFSFGENPKIGLSNEEQKLFLDKYDIREKEYILSVGSINKRKNISFLIEAYKQINTDKKLVIVGRKENQELNINNNIILTGYLNDEELKVLYKNALIFVFPSLYEGFGIPLIDAQSFGVPVLCSNIPVFREIGGDSVEYFQINNTNDLCIKLQYLLKNENALKDLIKKGEENGQTYYKDNIKKQILEVLGE